MYQAKLLDDSDLSVAPHPARYSEVLYQYFAEFLRGCRRVLDPFAGRGGVHLLAPLLGCDTVGIEIEKEWARAHPRTREGNALALPFADAAFDAICTSPCYGNRMADHHNALDGSRRHTYQHKLKRALHPDNAGALQWGADYREFHEKAWTEAMRVLAPGGVFVLNISDHIRAGRRVQVTAWHAAALTRLGLREVERRRVPTRRQRHGANADLRVGYESVIKFVKAQGWPAELERSE